MKHDWKRDTKGVIEQFGDDYPYAECRICGDTAPFPVIHGGEIVDDCEGVDLSVTVSITISHPGKATGWDDRTATALHKEIPLSVLLHADPDPVGETLADFVERAFGQWRGVRTEHEPAWRAAVEAASRSAEDTTEEVR